MPVAVPVAVVGGGIAGCAAALSLAQRGIPVAWIVAGESSEKPGETLAAAARPLLAGLGAGHLLADPLHRPAHVGFTAWGSAALLERHAAAEPGGPATILHRGRFEAAFRELTRRRGIEPVEAALADVRRNGAGWTVATEAGHEIAARLLIDATGRRAAIGRRHSAVRRVDRLVAAHTVLRQVDDGIDPTPATLVEAVPEGWWYATLLADRRLVVQFYSDPDLMPRGIRGDAAPFRALAERTAYIARWIESAGYALTEPPRLATAGTAWLETAAGPGWVAVGDAAAAFDPLSAHGMTTALWTGIEGAAAAAAALAGDTSAFAAYAARLGAGTARFDRERAAIYARETRFGDAPFWRRRREPSPLQPPAGPDEPVRQQTRTVR